MIRFIFAAFAVIFLHGITLGQESVYIKESFSVNEDALVDLNGKYGTIKVESWDELKVDLKIEIKIEGNREEDVKTMLEKLKVDIKGNTELVSLSTNLNEIIQWNKVSNTGSERVRIKFNDGTKVVLDAFAINYNVKLPSSNRLKIYNKYGDIHLGKMDSKTEIWLKYGELTVDELLGETVFDLAYVKGKINKLTHGQMKAKYSELTVEKASIFKIQSRYSTVGIKRVDTLLSESRSNNFKVGEVGFLALIERHTDFKADKLVRLGNIDMEYGSCRIAHIGKELEQLFIEGEYTDFLLDLETSASFQLDLTSHYGELRYPSSMQINRLNEEEASQKIEGILGSGAPGSRITIHARYGDIYIK